MSKIKCAKTEEKRLAVNKGIQQYLRRGSPLYKSLYQRHSDSIAVEFEYSATHIAGSTA
ncbi:MAG: hypothetical protein V7K50_12005 [Nostoc sp.]|uniref:hypothetical protein n=1 Tax=Nostoc sp. TaxID=1180 RepID=UPI002FF4D4A1